MNLFLRVHSHRTVLSTWSITRPCITQSSTCRKYSTHRSSLDPSLLSSASLDTKRSPLKGRESVGPFQLGPNPKYREENVKKWSELSTAGKVQRTTARTTNLAVVLLGGGLAVVLIYCLSSELFSKNSPTVLHSDACERIKHSALVAKHLQSPLVFHNAAQSSHRPRHRNHQVVSQIMVDSQGREHMLLNFFVEGRPPGSPLPAETYFEAIQTWSDRQISSLPNLDWEEVTNWSTRIAARWWDDTKGVFRYLTGEPAPSRQHDSATAPSGSAENRSAHPEKTSVWQIAGMFSSLKGSSPAAEQKFSADGKLFAEGEVHADLVRNSDGIFVYRYLLIDFPNSRDRNSSRVFLERAPGVRESEPVLRWQSS